MALVGAGGHGVWHRRVLHQLAGRGRLRVAGLCDPRPVVEAEGAPMAGTPVYADHRRMLSEARPDVVIVCTPPHTHLEIARQVVAAGADLLLEKPPVLSVAEHRTLAADLAASGRVCQVNFQALGSDALTQMRDLVAGGRLGPVRSVAAVGAWWRPDRYFSRADWAGRRTLAGRPVMDGALVNPFAHALMQALALAGADQPAPDQPGARVGGAGAPGWAGPIRMEVERYRTRPIDVDDLAFLRLTPAGPGGWGAEVLAAVTLASRTRIAGEIVVRGDRGVARLDYPTDRVLAPGATGWSAPMGRTGLLENLLDHRAGQGVDLIAPLARTRIFTMVAEAVVASPVPHLVDRRFLAPHPEGDGSAVAGISQVLRRVADQRALPSELGLPWARPPVTTTLLP